MPGLSKSKYTNFRKCPKCLWLGTYKPEEQIVDASTQARFDAGTIVGELAKNLFGDFTDVTTHAPDGRLDIKAMLARTQQSVAEGTENICEAVAAEYPQVAANSNAAGALPRRPVAGLPQPGGLGTQRRRGDGHLPANGGDVARRACRRSRISAPLLRTRHLRDGEGAGENQRTGVSTKIFVFAKK